MACYVQIKCVDGMQQMPKHVNFDTDKLYYKLFLKAKIKM